VVEAIEQVEQPALSIVRIQFFRAGERDPMIMVVGNKEVCELF
jgi:hypothetical protein